MSVGAWHSDFLLPYLQLWTGGAAMLDRVQEVLYLTDISVPHAAHMKLRHAIPLLRDCDETGSLTLNYFMSALHGPHLATPDVQAMLYLSPPTDGFILTPAHYDGHGTQTSVHAVLFGGLSNYNLVHTFPVEANKAWKPPLGWIGKIALNCRVYPLKSNVLCMCL